MADQAIEKSQGLPHQGLSEMLSKFSTAIKERLTIGLTPPIGPGSEPKVTPESLLTNVAKDLKSQGRRIPEDIGILISLLQTSINKGLVDDRKYLIERIVQLAASLPAGKAQNQLTGLFIETLWDNLLHPPLSYLGEEYKYRMADGSNNNIMYPDLGKAGSSYARSVTPKTQLPAVLPDPGVIFDALFAREGSAKEHPSKISSMLFYQASIIIHDVFRTNDADPTKVNSSSYLDLSPLYGVNQSEQNRVRTFQDGKLKPDAFAEVRLLGFPPGVGALLVCYSRFHNYVVEQLAVINEGGRFSLPIGITPESPGYEKAMLKRDNDLFQTGRLITCGLYVNIILGDYVRTILNLNRTDSTWSLDPRETFNNVFGGEGVPSGVGNQVSVEFNLIYRWHAAVSERDDKWTQDMYKNVLFPGQDIKSLSLPDFVAGLRRWGEPLAKQDPGERTFGGLKRKENGTGAFDDADLIKILTESTEDVAGAFGARNVPTILKAVEILGIEQSRQWRVATLNEFRNFFKLQPYSSFDEINSDKDVAETLKTLYVHPDYVELYPGLVAEEAKHVEVPGSGLCPGYTVATAILSDAVALVRGDRFYTVDYGSGSLTNWGFNEVSNNAQIANGGVMYKLLMRAFPGWFRGNSVYAMYPFTVPDENRKILRSLGKEEDFSFQPPSFVPQPTDVHTWDGVVSVLNDQANFKVPWGPHTYALTGYDYMLSGDKPQNAEQKKFVDKAIYGPKHGLDQVRQFYEQLTTKMVREQSHKLGNMYTLDAVRDVGNLSHAQFVAHLFHIPIKGPSHPLALLTDQDLYTILALLFAYVFLDLDSAKSFGLKAAATQSTDALAMLMKAVCARVKFERHTMTLDLLEMLSPDKVLSEYGTHLISRLFEGGKNVEEVVYTIIPTAAAAVATQAQGFAQMLDLFLSDKYKSEWPKIQALAESDKDEDFELLKKYTLEGYRLATAAFGLVRVVANDTAIQDGDRTINVKKGEHVFVNFVAAGVDPKVFPDPETIKLDRPESSYIHHGYGAHACLGRPIVVTAMASQLRVFARLKNLRRAPGLEGQMKSKTVNGAFKVYMREDWSDWWPFPTSMKVHFDSFGPEVDPTRREQEATVISGGISTEETTEKVAAVISGEVDPIDGVNGEKPAVDTIAMNGNH